MADRLDIAKLKLEKGLLSDKGVPSQDLATGLQGLFSGIDADVQAKRETRQKFKEESASDIRDLRSLRAEAEAAGATKDKSSSGQDIKLGDIPTSTTIANWTLSQLDGFIQDSYDKQEIVTSGLGGQFAVRDYNIFKNNQKQTWQAVKGRADSAAAELEETIRRAEGYTNDEGVFIPPVAGAGEAAFQRYQSVLNDLNNTFIKSEEDGMGGVYVYETVYDPATGVQKRVLDEDGNPVINKNISGTSVMALLNKQNSRWQKTDVISSVEKAFGKDVIASYQVSTNHPGYIKGSSKEDNIRRNPSFTRYQDTFIKKTLPNNRAVSSALTDNYGGEFYQLDPNQTASGIVDGVKIDMNKTISVSVLTGYDSNGKPLYADVKAPKYIGSKIEGDGIVVQTTDKHKEAASGIVRATIDGQLGVKVVDGVAIKQWDPYRKDYTKEGDDELNSDVKILEKISQSQGLLSAAERKRANEELMALSKYNFSGVVPTTKKDQRTGKDIITSTVYTRDGNEFTLTDNTLNPKFVLEEQVESGTGTADDPYVFIPKTIEKVVDGKKTIVNNPKYQEEFIQPTNKEREDNRFAIFGKGNVDEVRSQLQKTNKNYNVNQNINMGVDDQTVQSAQVSNETTTNPAVDPVSLSSAVSDGGPTLLANMLDSSAYKAINNGFLNIDDTEAEFKALASMLQSEFQNIATQQNAQQGDNVTITSDGEDIVVKVGDKEVFREGNDDLGNEGLIKAAMNRAIKELPSKEESTTTIKVKCVGGFKEIAGEITSQPC
jgi:DNA-binding protein YbaB